jgi:hypothetical protein
MPRLRPLMKRRDYYHDPDAPLANTLVPSTAVIRAAWGRVEIGEWIAYAAVRDVAERPP